MAESNWILGIAASHNSAAALIKDGRVIVAVQTERLVRRKRQSLSLDQLSAHAINVIGYCLRYAGIDISELRAIATCTPWDAVHARFAIGEVEWPGLFTLPPFISVPHHLAHAEYSLHYSPLEPSIVLVCDGAGSFEHHRPYLDIREKERDAVKYIRGRGKESVSAYAFDGTELELIYRIAYDEVQAGRTASDDHNGRQPRWMSSLGHLWEWCAYYCHGDRHEAGKVMGLAPYGDPKTYSHLGALSIDCHGEMRVDLEKLISRLSSPNISGADITGNAHYADIAAHVQQTTNDLLVELVRYLQTRYRSDTVCYSGGVALNSVANEYLRKRLDLNLNMNGSCEDNGTAIGAALAVHHSLTGVRIPEKINDCYGREYSEVEIQEALQGYQGKIERMDRPELLRCAAKALAEGLVVGWFQGRSEFGPRALGNRSILADARDPKMQDILNRRIKHREAFRPYAPAVIEERASEFFELEGASPVMLRVVPVLADTLPAVTHVDGSARVQTVNREQNAIFYDLLKEFESLTGIPVLLNTSFNLAGEPNVETPVDAMSTFIAADIDLLFMGGTVIHRKA
ncbi:MAG TPA: carbamoyltransferase C-terminal domain-containing protein [Puia sp.]|jgi:carbamoyltransferase|nr:carbamoyltransferase C-terminal domain-containing protein [Puia sp.]